MAMSWVWGSGGKTEADEKASTPKPSDSSSSSSSSDAPPKFYFTSAENDVPQQRSFDWGGWSESDWSVVVLRGKNYLEDKKKIPSGPHIFRLEHLDVLNTNTPLAHISDRPNSYANRRYEAECLLRGKNPANKESVIENEADVLNPLFIINFIVPLGGEKYCNLVLYFTRRRHSKKSKRYQTDGKKQSIITSPSVSSDNNKKTNNNNSGATVPLSLSPLPEGLVGGDDTDDESDQSPPPRSETDSSSNDSTIPPTIVSPSPLADYPASYFFDDDRFAAFDRLLTEFLTSPDDSFRDRRLKVIPLVAEGGWVARKVVNGVPAILGQKVKQSYYRCTTKNYIEISVDLGSSSMAAWILSITNSQAASLIVDISFILEGKEEEELPESLLGGARLIKLKLDKFRHIDDVGI